MSAGLFVGLDAAAPEFNIPGPLPPSSLLILPDGTTKVLLEASDILFAGLNR